MIQANGNRNLLIVDDEEIMRNFLGEVFSEEGYQLDFASDGDEAIEKIRTKNYKVVITDIRMPKVEGTEVLRVAKEISPQTEVIVITGYASEGAAGECEKLGAFAYVSKPFQVGHIRELVNKIIKRKPD
ncbi:MAG: hypothetical protein A2W07_00695 [candidate division Zixibacteria bacterium RBG_16_43_9]|nr:MAG: hypothetical protein A2W07_00695 [candidate division Zixibacteria bacterium RBG_16_43_9]